MYCSSASSQTTIPCSRTRRGVALVQMAAILRPIAPVPRRVFLLGAALAATSCRRGPRREAWESGPRLPSGHPVLRMPFPRGTVVLCQQGNSSPPGRTHFKENNRHALDLSNIAVPSLTVVAAAPGRVTQVFAGSDRRDRHAGLGYGNQIKVDHGLSYFTMYAHLDTAVVREGEVVESGAPLGTVGFTGAAGNRHLHFSLHQGAPVGMGVYETTEIRALWTAEAGESMTFRARNSGDLRDGRTDLWSGALYASENATGTVALRGPIPPDLSTEVERSRRALEVAIDDRRELEVVSRQHTNRGIAWAEAKLRPILSRAPGHAVGRYWRATAIDVPAGRAEAGEATYRELLRAGDVEPTWETWIVAWCEDRLGDLAAKRGQVEEAKAHYRAALVAATAVPERDHALAALRRLGEAQGEP